MAANEWSEKKRMIVTVAVGVVANLILAGVWYNANAGAEKKATELKALNTKLEGLKKEVANGPALEKQLKSLQLDFEVKARKLPDSQQVEKLIPTVSSIAVKSNCEMTAFIAERGTGGGGGAAKNTGLPQLQGAALVRDAWQTKWKADFHGWCKLMNELEEKYERFIAFENLKIVPVNSGMTDKNTRHDISVDVVTYRYIIK